MYKIYKTVLNVTVDYAAEELKKYLRMMMPRCGEIEICYDPDAKEGFRLGLMQDFGLDVSDAADTFLDDIVYVDTDEKGGIIAGDNPRSVLFAVYRYLRENGCRWLFPGVDGELIPIAEIKPVKYRKAADNRFRGQCNEGAESQQAMLDTIEFSPKIFLNCYMLEFDIPKTYYDGYYNHSWNSDNRKPEPVSADTVLQWKKVCEVEIAKRGLIFHDMGHGWTAETFGISSLGGWKKDENNKIPDDMVQYVAMLNGKRELCRGVALNTNFCMSNSTARKMLTDAVVEYAKINTNVDYLHVWLADWQQNHCECENCVKETPSDFYVILLNEIDAALLKEGLNTKIGCIIYSDTAWEPEVERINNPDRFVFLLGAITRSYRYSVEKYPIVPATPYVRNVSGRLDTMEEYMMHAHNWQKMGAKNIFAYEYHFWKNQFYAPGVISFAKRLYEDIISYKDNDFSGIIEDGSQRAFFPNGLNYYTYGMSLFDMSLSFEEIINDYFVSAYGEASKQVRKFFEEIDKTLTQDFLETIHSKPVNTEHYHDESIIPQLERVEEICDELDATLESYQNMSYRVATVSLRLLSYYTEYCRAIAKAFIIKAQKKDDEAKTFLNDFFKKFGKYEAEIERYYDQSVCRSAWHTIMNSRIELDQ